MLDVSKPHESTTHVQDVIFFFSPRFEYLRELISTLQILDLGSAACMFSRAVRFLNYYFDSNVREVRTVAKQDDQPHRYFRTSCHDPYASNFGPKR